MSEIIETRCAECHSTEIETVSPATHVPCCPIHSTPLVGTDSPGFGRCVSLSRRYVKQQKIGGQDFDRAGCVTWSASSWRWLPRSAFDYRDVPPEIGEPVIMPELQPTTYRLDVVRRCETCALDVPHAQVDAKVVCLKCGRGDAA